MSNVNSEQVMSKIRAEISDDTVAPDEPLDNGCLFHRGIDVAEIMRKIKHEAMFDRLLPDSADCSRNAENEISRRLEDICGEVERINSFIENTRILAEENMHPGRVIPVFASGYHQKVVYAYQALREESNALFDARPDCVQSKDGRMCKSIIRVAGAGSQAGGCSRLIGRRAEKTAHIAGRSLSCGAAKNGGAL